MLAVNPSFPLCFFCSKGLVFSHLELPPVHEHLVRVLEAGEDLGDGLVDVAATPP